MLKNDFAKKNRLPIVFCNGKKSIDKFNKDIPKETMISRNLNNIGDYNYGIVTGKISDLIVIDCDINKPDCSDEVKRINKNLLKNNESVLHVKTPNGYHHYYKYEDIYKNVQHQNLDIRTDCGYIIGPGCSINEKNYQLINDIPLKNLTTISSSYELKNYLKKHEKYYFHTVITESKSISSNESEIEMDENTIKYTSKIKIINAIRKLPERCFIGYDNWRNTAMAIKNCTDPKFDSEIYFEFDIESKKYKGYDVANNKKHWNSLKITENGFNFNSLLKWIKNEEENEIPINIANNHFDASVLFFDHYDKNGEIKIVNNRGNIDIFIKKENVWNNQKSSIINAIQIFDIKRKINDKYTDFSKNLHEAKAIFESLQGHSPNENSDFVRNNNKNIESFLFYTDAIFSFKDRKFYSYESRPDLIPFLKIDDISNSTLLDFFSEEVQSEVQIFHHILGDEIEVTEYYFRLLARGIAGHLFDKVYAIVKGARHSGKGTLELMLNRGFKEYCTTCVFPIVQRNKSDVGASNRLLLSMQHNIKRIRISNEIGDTKDSIVDGERIKQEISGGDPIVARVLYGGEITIVQNCYTIYQCNTIPEKIQPSDCLENCRVFETPYKFEKSTMKNNSKLKEPEDIKSRILSNKNFPKIMLSIVSHFYQDKSDFLIPDKMLLYLDNIKPAPDTKEQILEKFFEITKDTKDKITLNDTRVIFESLEIPDQTLTKWITSYDGITLVKNNKGFKWITGLKVLVEIEEKIEVVEMEEVEEVEKKQVIL